MYKHLIRDLSREERYQIQSLVRAQHTTAEIARLLGRHPSTIGRQINVAVGSSDTEPNKLAAKRLS